LEDNNQSKEGAQPTDSLEMQIAKKVHFSDSLHSILIEFKDLFAEANSLPPQRPLDHVIHLKPNFDSINIRAYRYPPIQKTEIENK